MTGTPAEKLTNGDRLTYSENPFYIEHDQVFQAILQLSHLLKGDQPLKGNLYL